MNRLNHANQSSTRDTPRAETLATTCRLASETHRDSSPPVVCATTGLHAMVHLAPHTPVMFAPASPGRSPDTRADSTYSPRGYSQAHTILTLFSLDHLFFCWSSRFSFANTGVAYLALISHANRFMVSQVVQGHLRRFLAPIRVRVGPRGDSCDTGDPVPRQIHVGDGRERSTQSCPAGHPLR